MSDADDRFIEDLGTLWEQTRDTIESFANKYLSAQAGEDKISGPEWVATNVKLAGEMWLLGLQSMSLVVKRTLDVAKEVAPNDPPK
jgi:hypothetical protein